jgi:LysR family carnitine catabolism transcriptional activator
MNVSIKQIRAFVAVARSKSFAEACTLVRLSQPALSISIKNLELAVGGKLLSRSTRSVELTPEGAEFFPVAQRLLKDWDRSLEDVHNLFTLRRGKLDIAAMPTFASSLLPEILAQYHLQYPDINVTIHDVIAESVVEMVRDGRVELGVSFDPGDARDLNFQPLFLDRFIAALPPGHALLEKKKLNWNDLKNTVFIALQRPSSIRLLLDTSLLTQGIELAPAFEAHQLASIGRMVASGLGCSVVPALSSGQMEEMGAVCLPIGTPAIARNVGLVTRKRHPLSVATQTMIEVIQLWQETRHKA